MRRRIDLVRRLAAAAAAAGDPTTLLALEAQRGAG